MDSVNVKEILNEIYQQSLTLGLAAALSMVLQKFTKMSLGTPMSLKPILTLAVALGLSASLLKVIEDRFKIPSEPFK